MMQILEAQNAGCNVNTVMVAIIAAACCQDPFVIIFNVALGYKEKAYVPKRE